MRTRGTAGALLASLVAGTGVQAQGEMPDPELELLEYLGSWQADDEEWFVISEWEKDRADAGEDDTSASPRAPQRDEDDRNGNGK